MTTPAPEVSINKSLVDPADETVLTMTGQVGELRFRGITVFDGYLPAPGAPPDTGVFDTEGWYRTGDLFEYVGDDDPPRLLRFVDRAKDVIIRGGMNISAAELEALIADHPAIVECAVVGYPDRDLGEKVGVFAVAASDVEPPTLEAVIGHLRDQEIASYKLPERLEVIDALPRNPVGKVVKPDLRDRWRDA